MSNQIETQIDVSLTERNRLTAFFRIILVVPAFFFVASCSPTSAFSDDAMSIYAGLLALPAALAIIVRQVYPSYVLAFNDALLSLQTRVDAYLLLLTDEYPSIEANQKVRLIYPEIEGGKKLSPWMPLVKWFLAIPLFLLGIIYVIYALVLTLIAWISVVKKGIYPEDKAEEVVKVIAYWNRLYGYSLLLVTDEYPSFSLN